MIEEYHPDLIFLSEPQLFACDAEIVMSHMMGEYCYFLNSHDKLEPDLPLKQSKAHGGTMVIWKRDLDPFITVRSDLIHSPSFLPLIIQPPGSTPSIHFCTYLPTCGRD